MRAAGFDYDAELTRRVEEHWAYQAYVDTVERVRRFAGPADAQSFYSDLLGCRVQDRAANLILEQIRLARVQAAREIAVQSAVLRARIRPTPLSPDQARWEEEEDA